MRHKAKGSGVRNRELISKECEQSTDKTMSVDKQFNGGQNHAEHELLAHARRTPPSPYIVQAQMTN